MGVGSGHCAMDFEEFIRQGNSLVEYAHEIVEVLQTEMVEVELKSVLEAFSVVADKALKGKENLSKATNGKPIYKIVYISVSPGTVSLVDANCLFVCSSTH